MNLKLRLNTWTTSSTTKAKFGMLKQSVLAVLFGLVIGGIVLLWKGVNPFAFYSEMIAYPFENVLKIRSFLKAFVIFCTSALAIAIAFKSGMFNIGVAGQMLFAQVIVTLVAAGHNIHWFPLLLVAIIAGAAVGAISGVLKAFFNVHEVVSTILLNWIILYMAKSIFTVKSGLVDSSTGTTKAFTESSQMIVKGSDGSYIEWIIPFAILAFVLLGFVLVYRYTKFGFALKSVGINPGTSKLSGINTKLYQILGITLSGGVAGILGAIMLLTGQSFSVPETPPAEGFQGIAVALIAFTNFAAIIPAALTWTIINNGSDGIQSMTYAQELNGGTVELLNGLIIYSIAISIVFLRFKPIAWIQYYIFTRKSDKYTSMLAKYRKASNQIKNDIKALKSKKTESKNQFASHKEETSEIRAQLKKLDKDFRHKTISLRKDKEAMKIARLAYIKEMHEIQAQMKLIDKKHAAQSIKKTINELKDKLAITKKDFQIQVAGIQSDYYKGTNRDFRVQYNAEQTELRMKYEERYGELAINYLNNKDSDSKTKFREEIIQIKAQTNQAHAKLKESYLNKKQSLKGGKE